MGKFSTRLTRPATTSPIVSATPALTHEGGPGYTREAKSDLFLLAVANMVGEDTYYETSGDRDDRFVGLVERVTALDPEWVAGFVPYLRGTMNMRSAAVVMAATHVRARLQGGIESATPNRQVIASALQRPDEPAEMLAYWVSRYGKVIPKPVKRGVADAVVRLYTERSALKYDGKSRAWRMADVIELARPEPAAPWQSALFKYLLDRRHHPENATTPDMLSLVAAREALEALGADARRALLASPGELFSRAGVTWEWLSGWAPDGMTAAAWSAVIPEMGHMALLRNLRNFDTAGVPDEVAQVAAARIADPVNVANGRQFPFRYLSAYRAAPSLRWAYPLEQALEASVSNIPHLPGRTLILVDTSGSMQDSFSKDGKVLRWDAAATFGVALGRRCDSADVVSFSSSYWGEDRASRQFPVQPGESLLRSLDRFKADGYFLDGGTDTAGAVRRHFSGHDRVVVITDEQAAAGDVFGVVPATTPTYTWNLAGYGVGHAKSGVPHRHVFAGLTDAAFHQIPLLEAGSSARWPWEQGA